MLKIIKHAESEQTSLLGCFITFIACLLLRDFLEAFTQPARNFFNADSLSVLITVIHFNAFYLGIALSLALALHFVTRSPITSLLKVILPCFILLMIAPITDYFFPHNEVYGYTYFSTFENYSLIASYFSFYGQFSGATLGMKLEIFTGLIGVFLYVYDKTHQYWKALFASWLAYTIIFIFAASQFVLKGLADLIGMTYMPSGMSFLSYFFIVNFFLGAWVCYLANKNHFLTVLHELPILRVLNYELMFLFGICIAFQADFAALKSVIQANPMLLIDIVLLVIAILFACLFVMTVNNLEDIEIDKISNADRAVVSGKIGRETYRDISSICLGLAVAYAAPVGTQAVFFILLFMGVYYLYSAPPLRLKQVTLLSKLAISGNSLLLLLLGYWVVQHHFQMLSSLNIPMWHLAAMFVLFTLAANFIDLKDVAGDKAAGVNTLPVVIGMQPAQYFCGLAFFLSYLSMWLILPISQFFLGCLFAGAAIQFYLLTRRQYNEAPVLFFYIASLLFLLAFLFVANATAPQNTRVEPEAQTASETVAQKIETLISDYNHYFKTNYTTFEPIKQEALARVSKFYAAVRQCTPGTYQYMLQYMAGVAFYTSTIEGKKSEVCVVASTFTIPGKTDGSKTCEYKAASRLLFTPAQAEFDGSGKFELDTAHLTPFQQVEINDCRYIGKLLNKQ